MAVMASIHDPKLSPELTHRIQADPTAPVHLILRVTAISDPAEAAIVAAGFQIHRKLTLVPIFAVTGPAGGVLDLVDQPWLLNADLDRPVHTHDVTRKHLSHPGKTVLTQRRRPCLNFPIN